MREYLPYIVVGVATGSVYALAAMGLVVTYTTSGVLNFAHGAVAMATTYCFYTLREEKGLPTPVAFVLAVAVFAPLLGLVIDRVLLRRLQGSPTSTYVVVSLGLLVALQGLAIFIYGSATRSVEPIFSLETFRFLGVNVGYDQLSLVVIAALAGVLLVVFFRRTHVGLQTRAVVDDAELTSTMGVDPGRITAFSWMLGCMFAGLAGVLLAPLLGVDAVILTLLVIQAFGAAAVGRLTSLPLTYAGAIVIAVAAAVSTKFIAERPALAGIPTSLPFIVLFLVLVTSRKGSFVELTKVAPRLRSVRVPSTRLPVPSIVGLVVVGLLVPVLVSGPNLITATAAVVFVLLFSSLGLLVGLARQVSLCHAVFVVFGATNLSHFQNAGLPYLPALLLGALVLVPVGMLLAIPAVRLSGLFLALATFGFGILAEDLLFSTNFVFGAGALREINRPELFGVDLAGDKAFYYFALAVVVIGVVAVEVVRVTRLGRLLRALADSPTAVQSLGINPVASRVLVFCTSAFLAAIAGGLYGTLIRNISAETFGFFQSLLWVTVLVTAGALSLGGAVIASVLLVATPTFFTSAQFLELQPILFGVAAILLAQTPNGIASLFRRPDWRVLAAGSRWRTTSGRHRERAALIAPEQVPA